MIPPHGRFIPDPRRRSSVLRGGRCPLLPRLVFRRIDFRRPAPPERHLLPCVGHSKHPKRSHSMRRILLPAVAAVLAASAGQAWAQGPGGREGPGGAEHRGGPPGGVQPGGVRAPNPGGAAPQREMNAPRATQPDRGPRAEGPARGAEGPPRGVERNRQAEPQQPNRAMILIL